MWKHKQTINNINFKYRQALKLAYKKDKYEKNNFNYFNNNMDDNSIYVF